MTIGIELTGPTCFLLYFYTNNSSELGTTLLTQLFTSTSFVTFKGTERHALNLIVESNNALGWKGP